MPIRRPTTLKVMDGEPPSRINTDAPMPKAEEPRMPGWFTLTQQQTWRAVVRQLRGMQLLHAADYDTLVNYVITADLCHRLAVEVSQQATTVHGGHGSTHSNPLISTLDRAMGRCTELAREFGLTPRARASLRMSVFGDMPADDDSPESFFNAS